MQDKRHEVIVRQKLQEFVSASGQLAAENNANEFKDWENNLAVKKMR